MSRSIEHHRVVADPVQLDLDGVLRGRHLLAVGAVDLRGDPERERVLHREHRVGVVQVGAVEQVAQVRPPPRSARGSPWRRPRPRPTGSGCRAWPRARARRRGRPAAPAAAPPRPRARPRRSPRRWSSRARAPPWAARRSASDPPSPARRRRAGSRRPTSASPRPIMTQAIAAMCMRSPAPTEPSRGTIGCTPRVEHRDEQLHRLERQARAAARGAADAREHRGAHVLGVERRADAARVRLDHLALVALQDVQRHAVVAHVPEAGVEAVDQPVAGDGAVDDRAAREDRLPRPRARARPARARARRARRPPRVIPPAPTTTGVGHEAPACATSSMPSSRSGSR